MRYVCALTKGGEQIATGTITVVCVSRDQHGAMKARPIPAGHCQPVRGLGRGGGRSVDAGGRAARSQSPGGVSGTSPLGVAAEDRRAKSVLHAQASARLALTSPRCVFPTTSARLPLTTKAELNADQAANPPWGTALTEPLANYTRYSQTSSTTGHPLRSTETRRELAVAARGAGRRSIAAATSARATASSFALLVRAVPRLLDRRFDAAGRGLARTACRTAGVEQDKSIAAMEAIGATVVCCTPT